MPAICRFCPQPSDIQWFTVWRSTNPVDFNPKRNARNRSAYGSGESLPTNPIVVSFPGCCARAASGHVAMIGRWPRGFFPKWLWFANDSEFRKRLIDALCKHGLMVEWFDASSGPCSRIERASSSRSLVFFGMRLPLFLQRRKAEAAIRKMYSWQPQCILLSHGRCFDADADKVIRRIFGEPPR
jgi:hypothetical protein